jgi:hypothetical protein
VHEPNKEPTRNQMADRAVSEDGICKSLRKVGGLLNGPCIILFQKIKLFKETVLETQTHTYTSVLYGEN